LFHYSSIINLFKAKHSWEKISISNFPDDFSSYLDDINKKKITYFNLVPLEIKKISIKNIFMQMRTEWPMYLDANQGFISKPVKLIDSPYYEGLSKYKQFGKEILLEENIKKTLFYKWWSNNNKIGYRYDWYKHPKKIKKIYNLDDIINKLISLIDLYQNILTEGFDNKNIVTVVEQPIENYLFNKSYKIDGHEIWSGHHRSSCLAAMGKEEIEVMILSPKKCSNEKNINYL